MAERHADVVVVGGGLAGAMAARTLARAGQHVVLLEARNRLGGRTWSGDVSGDLVDFGGQWTGPGHPRLAALLEEFGLTTEATFTDGRKVLDLRGRVSTYTGTIPRIAPWKLVGAQLAIWRLDRESRKVPKEAPWDAREARAWDGMTAETFVRQRTWSEDVVALTNAAARVIFGSELSELSLLHFLHYVESGGGFEKLIETHGGNQDRRIVGGSQAVSERLCSTGFEVRIGAPVRAMEQGRDTVTAHTDVGSVRARRAILAMPPPLAARIRYTPELPAMRDQLTQRAGMGATVKVFLRYERAFWRERGLSGEGVSTDGPVGACFDDGLAGSGPGLLAFIVGRAARGWSARPPGDRRDAVLAQLARWYGDEAKRPRALHEVDWADDPWTRGAPIATFPPGTLSVLGPALRAPCGRLHWAGTETARESTGFMEGALESGERAAAEVLAAG